MSAESDLTADLNEVETLLRRFAPTDSTVNRDTLMYQAGWSVAKAQTRGSAAWLWPATSAALAAALLISITFPASPLVSESGPPPQTTTPAVAQQPTLRTRVEPELVRAAPVPLKWYSPSAPLLVMRERALRGERSAGGKHYARSGH